MSFFLMVARMKIVHGAPLMRSSGVTS